MRQGFSTEWLQQIFTFPFQDEKWKEKFLIGSLLVFSNFILPVIPYIFVYGYFAEIMRGIIHEGREPFLPEWDEWDKKTSDGLKLLAITFILMLPFIILMIAGQGLFVLLPFSLERTGINSNQASPFWALIPILGFVGGMGMMGIGMLASLLVGFVSPVIYGHVIATGQFAAAFRIKEWWAILRANLAGYIAALLVVWIASFLMVFAVQILYFTIILCCFIPLLSSPIGMYFSVISGTVYGQAYRDGKEKLESNASDGDVLLPPNPAAS